MLVLCFTVLGVLLTLLGTVTSSPAAAASELGDFACLAVQICLLVSTPMYQRTRPGWSPGRSATGPFLPAPRLWMVLAGLVAGAAITLLSRFAGRILWIGPGRPPWLSPLAPHDGIQAVAFAAEWAEWGLAVLLALYLVWLRNRRESVPIAPWPPAPPAAPPSAPTSL